MAETALLHTALALYAVQPLLRPRLRANALLALAVALHTGALALRWQALGHGPFTTLHEILSSSLWSLALGMALAGTLLREVRAAQPLAAPLWWLLIAWLLIANPAPGHLPPTYDTVLLYLHALVGKLFLALLLLALVLALLPWVRRRWPHATRWHSLPAEARFDHLAHACAAFAFVCQTLMLIVGAVWAQDAWGRYWAWDPLERWAFVTWLALAAALHARSTTPGAAARRFGPWLAAVFALAFLSFFGVPFLSQVPHQGAI